ncbi:MAG TPA: 2-dehydropantoate 2-reductase [Micromonosporaceae bacterium]|nr:2-dehydropantoate 2-reductase [Micromonosporaceae bacterium]
MKIAVVGAGGVGGYFGGRLAQADHDVHLMARGPHLATIQREGLRVRSVKGGFTADVRATDHPAEIGPCDVVLFCVKSYDTDEAAARLGPLLTEETAVVSLQNGVDNEEKIATVIGPGRVVGGAAFIFSSIVEPGVIAHTGGPASILFGELDGNRTARVEKLLAACREAGIDADIPTDIRAVLWTKFAFICATAGMTAAVRLPLGDIRDCTESWAMFQRLFTEVVALARAEGVPIGDDVVARQLEFAASLPPDSYSSLHHDLVTSRRMELDALHGTVIRRAARAGVPVPASDAIYAILRPWELRNEPR